MDDALGGGDVPVLLAAECSVALTTLPTALRHRPDARVLWLDAHGDFNTPDTTPSGYLGGMALAGACGLWDAGLGGGDRCRRAGGARRRARPRRAPSARRWRASAVTVIGASPVETLVAVKNALDGAPVYVHLDLDVLDPEQFPAQFPAPGGLPPEKLSTCSRPWPASASWWAWRSRPSRRPTTTSSAQAAAATALHVLEPAARRDPGGGPCRRLKRSDGSRRHAGGAAAAARAGRRPARAPRARRGSAAARRRSSASTPQDKLTARERLALLIDEGTFTELGIHGRPHFSQRAMEGKEAPADGVITGYGKVDGRLVAVCAYDFTVMAGSMGMTGELKVTRLRELALGKRIPIIWLLDSAGARIQEAAGSLFAGSGHLFREEVMMSGVIPQVAALMGPCAAGTAYIPGLADFVPMVKGRGSMALAGPHLTKAVTGEDVTQEELGGSKVHTQDLRRRRPRGRSPTRSASRRSRTTCRSSPQNCEEPPPMREPADPRRPHATRSCSTSCPSRRASPTTCTT